MHLPLRLALALSTGIVSVSLALAPATATAQRPIAPFKGGDRYFFVGPDSALYVRDNGSAPPRLLLQAGTYGTVAASPDGDYIAYSTNPDDAPGQLRIRNVRSARDVNEIIPHAFISRKPWTRNSKGFLYIRVDTTNQQQRVYYHQLGDAPARDPLLYSRIDEPTWTYRVRVSDDGQFAIITVGHAIDTKNRLYFIDFDNPKKPTLDAPIVKYIDEFSTHTTFVDNGGNTFFLLTDRDAPLGQLVTANSGVTRGSRWQPIIRESADTLAIVRTAGEQYVIAVSRGAEKSTARVYTPPSTRELRQEYQKYLDSMRVAERNRGRGQSGPPRGPMRDYPSFRLDLRSELPVPDGGVLIDMTSHAEDEELFYTVRLPNGTLQSFMYNIAHKTGGPFNNAIPTAAAGKQ